VEEDILNEIKGRAGGEVMVNEMMLRHTTLRVGGPAEVFVEPVDLPAFRKLVSWARTMGIVTRVIGSGSNILVPDEGIKGITIRLSSPSFRMIGVRGDEMLCGAGARISDLVKYCIEKGMGGLEFLAAIPGTVGGAVAMNAGAWGRDIAGVIRGVTVVHADGSVSRIGRDGLAFGYRKCSIPRGEFIVSATFGVSCRRSGEIREEVAGHAAERRRRFPEGPSAGSIFKNPPGDYAGRMIEAAGLKGETCGRAQISTVHANFIVNLGGARAVDVLRLIEMAGEAVQRMFSVELEPEIDILSEVTA